LSTEIQGSWRDLKKRRGGQPKPHLEVAALPPVATRQAQAEALPA
jgi:hypothetical protein